MDMAVSGGITTRIVMSASRTLVVKRKTEMTTMVRPWMANWARPSWSSCWRFSMSLVILLMTTPAFSSVKKSRESRWRWRKMVTRRSFITHEARRPVTRTWPHCAAAEMATAAR
jgi:hypothetical protein